MGDQDLQAAVESEEARGFFENGVLKRQDPRGILQDFNGGFGLGIKNLVH